MKPARIAGLVAGLVVLVSAPASAAEVDLRVEGTSDTVVPRMRLDLRGSKVVKDGDPAHACTGSSAAGALEIATKGDWSGPWYEGLGYSVERIEGETHAFSSTSFWSLWVDYRPAEAGVCGVELKAGDDVLLFPDCYGPGCVNVTPLKLTAPRAARPGRSFTVKVSEYVISGDRAGLQPAAGATVTADGRTYETAADGTASVTGDGRAVRVRATKPDHVRSATESVRTRADSAAPRAEIRTPRRRAYHRGPRVLKGSVSSDPSGLRHVKLRLTRRHGGRCEAYSSRAERLRRVRCGRGSYFSIGDRRKWSYRLSERLPAGRYVLKAVAVDDDGDRDVVRTGRNRVVFKVR